MLHAALDQTCHIKQHAAAYSDLSYENKIHLFATKCRSQHDREWPCDNFLIHYILISMLEWCNNYS